MGSRVRGVVAVNEDSAGEGSRMKRAFTAVELAIVLVIIAILGVMLVPALSSARMEAVRAKCLSRVRQVGMAFEMYQMSHDAYWPSVRISVNPAHPDSPDPTGSLAVLYPTYASKTYLFQCPATNDIVNLNPEGNDFLNCMNFHVSPSGKATRPEDEGKRRPSPPSFFYDCGRPHHAGIPRDAPSTRVVYGDECVHGYREDAAGKGFWVGENNHPNEGGNFLFADKHVEWLDVHWSDVPYKKGRSLPSVPNTHESYGSPAAFAVYRDTNVFEDDTPHDDPSGDADLAGMMWIDQEWQEF
jgi:type II secretory pathway pseudopilin PulG